MGVPGKRLVQHRPELPIIRTEIVKTPPAAVKRLNPLRTARVVSASQVMPAAKAWQSLTATTSPTNSAQPEKPRHGLHHSRITYTRTGIQTHVGGRRPGQHLRYHLTLEPARRQLSTGRNQRTRPRLPGLPGHPENPPRRIHPPVFRHGPRNRNSSKWHPRTARTARNFVITASLLLLRRRVIMQHAPSVALTNHQ